MTTEAPAEAPQPATDSDAGKAAGMLVGVDGSSGAHHAMDWAAYRTDLFGMIQPMYVWHYPWWAYSSPIPPPEGEFKKRAQRDAEAALSSTPTDRYLDPIVCRGQAGPALVEAGASSNLIVVGTRGRSGLKDSLLGSVSSHVVAHSTVPVAVVPKDGPVDDPNQRVVVGIDGSANSLTALIWAVKHAPPWSTIEAVHSWSYPSTPMPGLAVMPAEVFEEKAQYLLNEAVRAAGRAAGTNHHKIVQRLEYGDARSVLRTCAEESDLLVLGARGRSGVAHLLLGSVTTALVHQPTTTTVLIPTTEH